MIIITHWRIEGTLQYYLPHMALVGMHHFQKRGNMQKIGKWNFHFPISSKTVNITYGTKGVFFHHIWASTKAAPDIGGIGIRTPRNWNHFSKMNGIFGHFLTLRSERVKRGEGRSGCKNPEFPPGTPNMKLESQICSLLKVIRI